MAGSSLLALIDDIATILDDVSLMTKTATKKTAGVLGDDLALNAQQVTGVSPARELPVVWAVAKGSLVNKAILVPVAVAISFFASWLVTPLLMFGGAFLCFEGFEKLAHKFLHRHEPDTSGPGVSEASEVADAATDNSSEIREKKKIRGAVRTDFVLSAEIIAITLGTVTSASISMQFTVLTVVAVMITVGVYGLVAGIVKLDDGGLYLTKKDGDLAPKIGRGILWLAPYFMKSLSVVGTIAMFLVGGGIITHGLPPVYGAIHHFSASIPGLPESVTSALVNGLFGVLVGAVLVMVLTPLINLWQKRAAAKSA
jgi:predicted DNA repair protein MutK